jgi:hypothetical protein
MFRDLKRPGWVYAFDPGVKTGFAVFYVNYGKYVGLESEGSIQGETDDSAIPSVLRGLIEARSYRNASSMTEVIVYERFDLRSGVGAAANLTPKEVIGGLKAYAFLSCVEIVGQPAAGRKTMISDTVLKELKMYSTDRDAREAIRHGLIYLLNIRQSWLMEQRRLIVGEEVGTDA